LQKLQGPDILKLLIVADEMNIQPLTSNIQKYLIKNKEGYIQQNSIEILEKIYQNNDFTDLQNFCIKKICEDPERLINSNRFTSLKAPLLELLFKSDDLPLDEIDIWNNLIKWCQAQNSNISQDPTHWNNEEITIMERTIHKFIPLIRFCYISPESFVVKVFPFKDIMPRNLINDILLFHVAQNKQSNKDRRPPRQSKCNVDSVIINQNHIKIFANWINRKEKISEYIPYKFNLLYRASRDGNTTEAFHAKCDNKGATLVIVKIENSDQIVGGYNPLSWDTTSSWKPTYDSFIFSSTDINNLQSAKVCYSYGHAESIGCHSDKGPTFGWDFNVYEGVWYSDRSESYFNVGLPGTFNADDYEVFQVKKK
jgi:hypothetical protein